MGENINPHSMQKSGTFVRFSHAQRAELERIALSRGLTISDVVREAAIRQYELPTPQPEDVRR